MKMSNKLIIEYRLKNAILFKYTYKGNSIHYNYRFT